jgi:hypothetical protein
MRSETNVTLAVPRTRTRMGDKAFAVAGPRTYNELPTEARRMTSSLKSHLL